MGALLVSDSIQKILTEPEYLASKYNPAKAALIKTATSPSKASASTSMVEERKIIDSYFKEENPYKPRVAEVAPQVDRTLNYSQYDNVSLEEIKLEGRFGAPPSR
jgi:hypothetical protein